MASVTRSTKTSAGGGTEFADDTPALASEVNADFNTLFGALQGNLNDTNIDTLSWSKITGTKNPDDIDDSSATTAEMDADKDPGDASSLNLATDLEEEIQHLRRVLLRHGVGEGAIRRDTSGTASNEDVAWYELSPVGPNLIPNGNLNIYTGDSSSQDAPDLWTKAATPSTLEPVSLGATEGEGQAIHIVSDAASEGIQTTVGGLKASTRYLLQVKAKVASGSFTVTTDHSDGSTWDDADRTITGSGYVIYGFVLVTDSSATDLDVNLHSDASGDDFTVAWVSLRELSDRPFDADPEVSDAMFDSDEFSGSQGLTGTFADVDDGGGALTVSVKVPAYGTWRVRVLGAVTTEESGGSVDVKLVTSGASSTEYPVARHNDFSGGRNTSSFERMVYPAANGSTYTYKLQAKGSGTTPDIFGTAASASVSDGDVTFLQAIVERAW